MSSPIEVSEIILALHQLGGEAQAKDIKDQVTENRGGIPEQYGRRHSFRETIQKIIEDNCPQSANFRYEAIFERTFRGRYKLIFDPHKLSQRNIITVNEPQKEFNPTVNIVVTQPTLPEFSFISEDDEEVFPEGKEIFQLHKSRERNERVVEKAKNNKMQIDPLLVCDICGFSFIETYGEIGKGYIEAHHILPLSSLTSQSETHIQDIVLVCSNCHRMLHRKRPWISHNELKQLLDKNKG